MCVDDDKNYFIKLVLMDDFRNQSWVTPAIFQMEVQISALQSDIIQAQMQKKPRFNSIGKSISQDDR